MLALPQRKVTNQPPIGGSCRAQPPLRYLGPGTLLHLPGGCIGNFWVSFYSNFLAPRHGLAFLLFASQGADYMLQLMLQNNPWNIEHSSAHGPSTLRPFSSTQYGPATLRFPAGKSWRTKQSRHGIRRLFLPCQNASAAFHRQIRTLHFVRV